MGTSYSWSTGCVILGSDSYTVGSDGKFHFNKADSRNASMRFHFYLGASAFYFSNPNNKGKRKYYGYFTYENNSNGNGAKMIIK